MWDSGLKSGTVPHNPGRLASMGTLYGCMHTKIEVHFVTFSLLAIGGYYHKQAFGEVESILLTGGKTGCLQQDPSEGLLEE